MKHAPERRLGFQEARVVNDFNTLPDLINHAARDLGATHVSGAGPETKIYFPRGGEYPYEEASVRRKGGYWHADGPGAREGVKRLPAGAKPIAGHAGRRAAEPRFKLGAPRPGTTVRDYEAVDNRGRRIAGPSKSYSDMKRAAGTAGVVKFVRPGASEAKRGGAQAEGERYAEKQIKSTHFDDWVRDQLVEASKMPEDQVLPLETPDDARKIARKMLQQLEWDAKRDSGDVVPQGQEEAFWRGFHKYCMEAVPWLADELLTLNREMRGATEARRRPKAKKSAKRRRR